MKNVLITGGSGLLGQYLNIAVAKKFNIYTTFKNNPGNCKELPSSKVDILNKNELNMLFQEFHPESLVNVLIRE